MKEIRHLKTIKNKINLNTKLLLLQNDQNADTTLLHSHDELCFKLICENANGTAFWFWIIMCSCTPFDHCFGVKMSLYPKITVWPKIKVNIEPFLYSFQKMLTAPHFLTKNLCPFANFHKILDPKGGRPITTTTLRLEPTFWADLWKCYNGTAFWSLKFAHFPLLTTVLISNCLYIVISWSSPKLRLNNNNIIVFYTKTRVSMTFSELICKNANGTAFWSIKCAHFLLLSTVLESKCFCILKSPCSLKLRLISNHFSTACRKC